MLHVSTVAEREGPALPAAAVDGLLLDVLGRDGGDNLFCFSVGGGQIRGQVSKFDGHNVEKTIFDRN